MSEEPRPQAGQEQVGSLGEEAAKLFGALSGWAEEHAGEHAGEHADEPRAAPGASAECSWCPVCRTVHAVRHASPEVRAQLTTAAQSLLSAASALLAAAQPPPSSPASRVERIDLEDTDVDSDVEDSDVEDGA